jgi:hypothetical protein
LLGGVEEAKKFIESLGYTVDWEPTGYEGPGLPKYRAVITDTAGRSISSAKNSGKGGGGGKKEFKNDFDKYYNMVEDINELQRLRNLLETDYN